MSAADLPEKPDGAKTQTVKAAARQLGVGPELLVGLIIGKSIRGYRATGRSGEEIVLIDRAEMPRLVAIMGGGG